MFNVGGEGLAGLMQQNFCLVADTGIGNSVIIGHFNLVLGGSSDV